jgi:formylglycine-generating enzyme required for sulfatase activity
MAASEVEEVQGHRSNPSPTTSWKSPGYEIQDSYPVTCVSRHEAIAFAQWLSQKEGKHYRLPTEAEWEYACRAGTQSTYNLGDTEEDLDAAGWYIGNSGDTPHPVGLKKPNRWGLQDMHGNVGEWCMDIFGPFSEAEVTDPQGSSPDRLVTPLYVIRGGGYDFSAKNCRSAGRRFWAGASSSYPNWGFRIVLDVN